MSECWALLSRCPYQEKMYSIGAVESPEEILSCLKSTVHVHKVYTEFQTLLNLHFWHYHYNKTQAADLSYMYAGN